MPARRFPLAAALLAAAASPLAAAEPPEQEPAPEAEAVVAVTDAAPPAETKTDAIAWRSDLRTAHAASVKTGKPLLILFGAEWCVYCHKQTDETLSDPKLIARVNGEFIPVRLDFDEHAKVAEVLEVETLPQAVILSPKADLLGRAAGFHNRAQFGGALTTAQQTFRRVKAARIAAAPTDSATL